MNIRLAWGTIEEGIAPNLTVDAHGLPDNVTADAAMEAAWELYEMAVEAYRRKRREEAKELLAAATDVTGQYGLAAAARTYRVLPLYRRGRRYLTTGRV